MPRRTITIAMNGVTGRMCDQVGAGNVGVCLDTYHIWRDPQVYDQIARAGERIFLFQVCDFLVPVPAGALLGRGHVGDGVIETLRTIVERDREYLS